MLSSLHVKLARLCFTIIIFYLTQAVTMMAQLEAKQPHYHLMMNRNVLEDFNWIETNQSSCVVLGDAEED